MQTQALFGNQGARREGRWDARWRDGDAGARLPGWHPPRKAQILELRRWGGGGAPRGRRAPAIQWVARGASPTLAPGAPPPHAPPPARAPGTKLLKKAPAGKPKTAAKKASAPSKSSGTQRSGGAGYRKYDGEQTSAGAARGRGIARRGQQQGPALISPDTAAGGRRR